jgi:hypothetical protein
MSNENIANVRNWLTIDNMDSKDYDKAAENNGWLKFDNNSECRYNDDWSFAMVTHYSHT